MPYRRASVRFLAALLVLLLSAPGCLASGVSPAPSSYPSPYPAPPGAEPWGDEPSPVICYDVLPDGLSDTDALCIIVLGFRLNPDGSMQDELIERLKVALSSAEKYPNAVIFVTGGRTASENPEATEAGRMAEWLTAHGVDAGRILREEGSLSTKENAQFTLRRIREDCPQVTQLALVSSDYHIPWALRIFRRELTVLSEEPGGAPFTIEANAACKPPETEPPASDPAATPGPA